MCSWAPNVILTCLLTLLELGRSMNETSSELQINSALQEAFQGSDLSLSKLESALAMLVNLTESQKIALEKQELYEQEIKQKHRAEEIRELARSEAMKKEQELLNSIRSRVSRKVKQLNKQTSNGNAEVVDYEARPKDCADYYLERGEDTSGVYRVWPTWTDNSRGFLVYCDMETDGGGWTVIHRWSGSQSQPLLNSYLKRNWATYKRGFGDLTNTFWLGNQQIHQLSNQGKYEVRFESQDENGLAFSSYNSFWIEDDTSYYKLHVTGYNSRSGNAGDVMQGSNGNTFSTNDQYRVELRKETRTSYNRRTEEVTLAKCTSDDTNPTLRPAWWYNKDCTLNEKLRVPSSQNQDWRKELKIRPISYLKLKEKS